MSPSLTYILFLSVPTLLSCPTQSKPPHWDPNPIPHPIPSSHPFLAGSILKSLAKKFYSCHHSRPHEPTATALFCASFPCFCWSRLASRSGIPSGRPLSCAGFLLDSSLFSLLLLVSVSQHIPSCILPSASHRLPVCLWEVTCSAATVPHFDIPSQELSSHNPFLPFPSSVQVSTQPFLQRLCYVKAPSACQGVPLGHPFTSGCAPS